MITKLVTIAKITVALITIALAVQLSTGGDISWATEMHDIEKQTVPTRTPTPLPATPTEPPPTVTNTPPPPPPTDTPAPPPEDTPPPASPLPTATESVAMVTIDSATNVYMAPDPNSGVLGALQVGQGAVVVGRNADSSWWQIQFQGGLGWVPASAVTPNSAARRMPVVEPAAGEGSASAPATLPQAGSATWVLGAGGFLLLSGVLLLFVGLRTLRQKA